jgi:hypothetical protein
MKTNYIEVNPRPVEWRELIPALVKVYTAIHSIISGNLHPLLHFSTFTATVNAIVGLLAAGGLLYKTVRNYLNSRGESDVLRRFGKLRQKSLCPFARKTKLFAGEVGNKQNIQSAVVAMLPKLITLTEIGRKRKLDGLVIDLPAERFAKNLRQFSKTFNSLLREIAQNDPTGENCLQGKILREGWQFTFNHTRFFVTSFAPFYDPKHPRYSQSTKHAFVYLQPEYSFDNHGISNHNAHREQVKENIRKAFQNAGSRYDIALVKQPFEALKYVKPLIESQPPIRWWKS